ncbi:Mediator of RNA polymerase II transcription subunit 8 [Pseudolycoriella hygida]|uniref:Mediator of RNA polymerase II transcription subunit 8 n=1 Tax=Pseudolycoriella hygida TaxID=35572 RepID=A0A9Q0MUW4_9DIPT|nr:Mediator of RNA polymerase II transcription subunit 8 [Pseudolycoriella hygida]
MQREEKQRESMLDALQTRLNDLKVAIGAMIHKIETEYETINWPTFLDNFALISSHASLTGLTKILSHEMGTPLRNLTVLPLMLSPERDEALMQLTEGRIAVFSHDMVPDYLRTKPEPTAEQRMLQHEQKANSLIAETAIKQVAQYTKIVSHVFDSVSKAREEWEVESSTRSGIQQTSSMTDTHTLVSAIGMGKGLKGIMPPVGGPAGMIPPSIRPQASMSSVSPSGTSQIGKAPSAIKTNIKSANQIHPYGR